MGFRKKAFLFWIDASMQAEWTLRVETFGGHLFDAASYGHIQPGVHESAASYAGTRNRQAERYARKHSKTTYTTRAKK